ncbi:MAG: YggT family protein [Sphingomonadales bacterium]|nr:YggT family protein [Sphingomonadales bacterium]MBD3775228.1 YggT family protein [Paracoccaceae bacterium]
MVLDTFVQILDVLINVIVMLVIVQFVIGLLFSFNVINSGNDFLMQIYRSIDALLRPALDPIRRAMPATGAIDFSPMVLIIGLTILQIVFGNLAAAYY